MIAYNEQWLDALLIRDHARDWHRLKWMSDESWEKVQQEFKPGFYMPNVFVRIGLAIFSFILMMAAMGLVALMGFPDSEAGIATFSIVFGFIWLAILEFRVILSGRHLRSGIDDMLLYVALFCLIAGIVMMMPYDTDILVYYTAALPLLILASMRYLDRLATLGAYWCALSILFFIVSRTGPVAMILMPVAGMVFSTAVYFAARKAQRRYDFRHWYDQLVVLEMLAILTFYASGNFWVLEQAAEAMYNRVLVSPLNWFFWAFTLLVPLAYVYWGFRHKERLLMDMGLGCVALAVFTYRFYFHVLPLAWAASIAGAIMFAGAYYAIRYLRKNDRVYTYAQDGDASLLQEIEEQLIEQTIANQPVDKPSPTDKMGGGNFGGSGAGGEF